MDKQEEEAKVKRASIITALKSVRFPAKLPYSLFLPLMKLNVVTVSDVLERHLARVTANTRRAYRFDLGSFAQWNQAETAPHALYELLAGGRETANRTVNHYETSIVRRLARSTVHRRISAIKSFVAAAMREGLVNWRLDVLPTKSLSTEEKRATGRRNMGGPTEEQLRAILEQPKRELAFPAKRTQAIRDLAIIALLGNPMLRVSELSALNMGDIKGLSGKTPSVSVIGKGRMVAETLPLAPSVVRALILWLSLRKAPPSAPLFVRVRNPFGRNELPSLTNERLTPSGIYKITVARGATVLKGTGRRLNPHAMRHHGVTRLAAYVEKNGISFQEAMQLSRHKKLDTFMIYVDSKGKKVRSMAEGIDAG